ncbi:hypothetical protein FXF51_41915 [Nonomuraea sp. PA05]|uniref:hypothetical protein n=1 Tax=Nonomuraea sp. PA05 TaxID=2604466 RepID=UPI0011D3BE4F|nr:hypothetical protein [Nonomuraea sp. PA05]TYB57032.1 hypothetical protein FXF51_41915 [Nonomuraea sp. PA05]
MRISALALLAAALLATAAPASPAAADVPGGVAAGPDPERVCLTVPVQALAQAFTNFFRSGSAGGSQAGVSAATSAAAAPGATSSGVAAAPETQILGFQLPRDLRVLEAASC